ncbi:MAG TPA: hypothetical protein VJ476_01505 [Rhizomicrobium sp.]|nr:hypothetical protein [Rhizomicrobium sp.]
MKLFSFASKNLDNIWLGVEHQKWAVATVSQSAMAGRATKADRYLIPGVHGLLYCSPLHAFTVPFVVTSHADPIKVIKDIWPEGWSFPFSIRPFGDPRKQVKAKDAMAHWPVLIKRQEARGSAGGVSAALNITGATVFSPVEITQDDWAIIIDELAIPSDYEPEEPVGRDGQ